ncbi:ommochrome-binding protein-like [Spodoptera litura]|uniref:Ommochrome-binding protein-like n=1 Tax=Spodoptera litura TaxID=69820 RepID=A0A9J7EFV1_SPOLT|nr:ommochrome-binding protein-like [Spodoptera litura]
MITDTKDYVVISGVPHKRNVILADANIPYKFSIDRKKNTLFFCINADEFSDQSFQSVALNLDTGLASIVPGIRNGYASAVNQTSGEVYLGGSDGIFKYNYSTSDIDKPALVNRTDIFDMYFHNNLFFVDTAKQNLYEYKDTTKLLVPEVKENLIQHFVIDGKSDLYFINPTGLFVLVKGSKSPVIVHGNDISIRGATTDAFGTPYFIAHNGIYSINKINKQLSLVLPVNNGYAVAFDKSNNIIYSDERSVNILSPC